MNAYEFFVGLELTRHCNLRCVHCLRDDLDKPFNMPLEFVRSILEQAKAYNKPHIALTGGEVTLHPQFGEIIDLIAAEGFRFHFVTNGTTFPSVMARIGHHASGPHWAGVSVSLDGATEKTHDSIRGAGVFRKAINTIAIAKAKGLGVTVQMVINQLNRHELKAMAELCIQLNVNNVFYAHMQPTPHGIRDDIVLPPNEWRSVDEEILHLANTFNIRIEQAAGHFDIVPLSHCKFLKNSALNIDYAGRLTVCCQLSNTGGPKQNADIVADLHDVSLADAHSKLLDVYNDIHKARLKKISAGKMHNMDHYHCWFCMKHFKKVEYLKDFPNHPWTQADPDVKQEVLKNANKPV